jgi:hypothetical protein
LVDAVSRGAARWATIAAVPLALLAGLGAFAALGGFRPTGQDAGSAEKTSATTTPAPHATGPVSMPALDLPPRAQVVCRALLAQLPDAMRDARRRPVSAGPEHNAAYGEPPITVACGGTPATYPPTDRLYGLDAVCWHAAPATAGATVWTTVDREVPVRVTVPKAYEAPGQWVIEMSAPVAAAIKSIEDVPSGCRP